MNITISVRRYNPETDPKPTWVEYLVPAEKGTTVMESLQYIYENTDSTLAFRQGCRHNSCGLCALMVNDKPKMACSAKVKDHMKIAPLLGMTVIRDLVTDRSAFFEKLRKYKMFISEQENVSTPITIIEPKTHVNLLKCLECLSCNSTCPEFVSDSHTFPGPYIFVKLAQQHFDPRDTINRKQQAAKLSIDKCNNCNKCFCINGISIHKEAIDNLT
ncbi:MAG: succinate dehydrogenase/fumarate reductase iron-sulfur subunit [Proteobacteria bacterium]|nr:succinate dehydrogenase/fumarate reductase iron-sulfur subunit [Pseudomonadota bacterium]